MPSIALGADRVGQGGAAGEILGHPDGGQGRVATPRLPAMSDAIAPGQPADSAPYKATEAIAFGWRKFKEHPSTLLVPMIVVLVVLAVVALIFNFVAAGGFFGDTTCDSTSF